MFSMLSFCFLEHSFMGISLPIKPPLRERTIRMAAPLTFMGWELGILFNFDNLMYHQTESHLSKLTSSNTINFKRTEEKNIVFTLIVLIKDLI